MDTMSTLQLRARINPRPAITPEQEAAINDAEIDRLVRLIVFSASALASKERKGKSALRIAIRKASEFARKVRK